jgi:hypothetical protein
MHAASGQVALYLPLGISMQGLKTFLFTFLASGHSVACGKWHCNEER